MIYILSTLNALLMITLPIGMCIFLARRFGVGWGLAGVGALTFIGSQVVHLPLLWGLTALSQRGIIPAPPVQWKLMTNAIILGLAAGLCEEIARYLVYRWWLKSARSWKEALMFGAGHGGIEAVIFGVLAALTVVNVYVLSRMDLSTLPLNAEQLAATQQQLSEFLNAPWYARLLGAVERIFALCIHISAAVLVLQAFIRKNLLWLVSAILWHALIDGVAVYAVSTWGPYWTEVILGAMSLVIGLGIIVAFRKSGLEAATVSEADPTGTPRSAQQKDGHDSN